MLSLKVPFIHSSFPAVIVLLLIAGCRVPGTTLSTPDQDSTSSRIRTFALSQSKAPPEHIQSLQLHPAENSGAPPIIRLGSEQQLLLSFDLLEEQNRRFRVTVSHRTKEWKESAIPPAYYLDSFSYTHILKSKQSFTKDPVYQHYSYAFPNDQLQPAVSGNYLLEVYDNTGDNLLFSLPFFITEDEGELQTRVETLFAQRKDGRSLARLFSTYRYPDFVEFPQYDLSISFAPDRFWGLMRPAGFTSTAGPGTISGHLDRDQAFINDYEFRVLDIRDFDADGRQIIEFRPGSPPELILRRDVQNLDTNPRFFPDTNFGLPLDDRNSRYVRVHFSLDADRSLSAADSIYLTGGFTDWMISEDHRMKFDETDGLWKGSALIKQGQYAYKYVLGGPNGFDDLRLDRSFRPPRREFVTFVYFNDPERKFDRLLKIGRQNQPYDEFFNIR